MQTPGDDPGPDPGAATWAPAERRVRLIAPPDLTALLFTACTEAGLMPDSQGPVAIVAARGAVSPRALDSLMREGLTHLLVTEMPTGWLVGPLVVPGRSACVRCVDLHLSGGDPRFQHLVGGTATVRRRPDEHDAASLRLALAWAARDVAAQLASASASTVSATITLGPAAAPVHNTWPPHPHCGCTWDLTMAAEA
ncbi:MAG: hypothetical protein ACSLEW_11515 [Nocardioides sp.]